MFYVYVLQNEKKQWYTGSTHDLRRRFIQHDGQQSKYTSYRGPYELIYYEACRNEKDARMREKYLKSGMGRRYLKNRLKNFLADNRTGRQHESR